MIQNWITGFPGINNMLIITENNKITAIAFNPLKMYLADVCTVPVNIAGVPAISVPVGTDSKGLPIGMQIIGKAFDENTILRVAYNTEK